MNTASFCLIAFIICGLLSFIMSKIILHSWGSVFVISGVVLAIPFVVFIPCIERYLDVITLPSVWLKISLVLFLILPIAWRIFYNWLYSSVYSLFIHTKIREEYQTYLQTKTYLKSNQSDMIDKRYNGVLVDFFNKKGDQDTDNVCAEQYVNLITDQCNKIPSIKELLKHRNDKLEDIVPIGVDNQNGEKEMVQPLGNQPPVPAEVFEELFLAYEKCKSKKTLQVFCKEKNINAEQFQKYRRMRLKREVANYR